MPAYLYDVETVAQLVPEDCGSEEGGLKDGRTEEEDRSTFSDIRMTIPTKS